MFALSYSNIIHCHPFSENTQLVSPGLHMFGPITPMRNLIGSTKGLITRLVSGLWEWVGKMLERVEGSSSWVISRECTWVALLEPDQAITQLGATTSTPPTARCIAATFGHSLKHTHPLHIVLHPSISCNWVCKFGGCLINTNNKCYLLQFLSFVANSNHHFILNHSTNVMRPRL